MSDILTEGNCLSDLLKWEADDRYSREKVTIKAGSGAVRSLVLGEVIGKALFAAPSAAADEGNTGDGAVGTVSLGSKAHLGDYLITCIQAAVKALGVGSIVANPGNTGDGAAGAVAVGVDAVVGDYLITCIQAATKALDTPAIAADGGNTGNGAPGAVTAGSEAIVGDYILTCITAAVDGGVFQVIDPNGERLEDLTVGVAYLNNHFGLTLADGAIDFAEGDKFTITMAYAASADNAAFEVIDPNGARLEDLVVGVAYLNDHFGLTIADGTTDFVVGDYFTLSVAQAAAADNSVFEVITPEGVKLDDLVVGVAYASEHLNLTIADGDTDFALGDLITITVSAGTGQVTALDFSATDGRQLAHGIMLYPATAPDGSTAPGVALVRKAKIATSYLTWPDGATTAQKTAALALLAAKGIVTVEEV